MILTHPHILIIIAVLATTVQYVQSYVIHRFPDGTGFRYPSIVSKIGQPINNTQSALLFIAPLDNINFCKPDFENTRVLHYPRAQYSPSSSFENVTDFSLSFKDQDQGIVPLPIEKRLKAIRTPEERHLQSSDSLPLALYIMRGRCPIAEKARNAMLFNDKYHSRYGGASIKYLIIVNDAPHEVIDRDDIDTVADPPINLHIVYLSLNGGKHLFDLVNKNIKGNDGYHLTESTFYPMDNEENNDFTFKISIDEIYLTSDIQQTWRTMLYIFLGIVILIPCLRFVSLLFLNRGCRWRRNENGRVNGVVWNRQHDPHDVDWIPSRGIFMVALGDVDEPIKLTEEQVNALPTIEYGVSDIEAVTSKHKAETVDKSDKKKKTKEKKASDETKNLEEEDYNLATKSFLKNAYVSCTSCSICISEFTKEEKLILLPNCGHFFHRDCILPWLTGRKGNCPLCQTMVLEQGPTSYSYSPFAGGIFATEEEEEEEGNSEPATRSDRNRSSRGETEQNAESSNNDSSNTEEQQNTIESSQRPQ